MKNRRFTTLTAAVLSLLLCLNLAASAFAEAAPPNAAATDYSINGNWYKIPEITKEVDTFFIYPTVYVNLEENAPDYAPLGDPMMLEGVDGVYQLQASVFEDSTNLFMPYYRQANITIEVETFLERGDIQSCLENLPEIDINAALDYYFEHYNQGRPFILAGHFQGAA